MKHYILLILCTVLALGTRAQGQKGDSPEAVADKRADHLKTELGLSEDQRSRVKAAVLLKNEEYKAIKARYKDSANKKGMGQELKAVNQKFRTSMDEILDKGQKDKYEEMNKRGDGDEVDTGDKSGDKALAKEQRKADQLQKAKDKIDKQQKKAQKKEDKLKKKDAKLNKKQEKLKKKEESVDKKIKKNQKQQDKLEKKEDKLEDK